MGGQGTYLDIVIMAIIAGVLIWRLRSVLGQKHGDERQRPNPFGSSGQPDSAASGGIDAPGLPHAMGQSAHQRMSSHARILQQADISFDEQEFIQGAKIAFKMIVEAFAKAELAVLQGLLDENLFQSYKAAIAGRQSRGEKLHTEVVAIDSASLSDARVENEMMFATVRFESRQNSYTLDRNDALIDGQRDGVQNLSDIFTFRKTVQSSDPNWQLVHAEAAS